MRRLRPDATSELEQLSPVVWRSGGDDPGFVFDVDPTGGGFIGFFLMAVDRETAPRVTFDDGSGFSEISALTMKGFPFAFYHVSLARTRGLKRLRFRPCKGPGTIRFVALQTANSILIAILHFLFNLRYQKIGIVAPNAKGRTGRLEVWKNTIARIIKFFRDVSTGGGVRVQEGAEDVLPVLKLAMTQQAAAVRADLLERIDATAPPLISFIAPTYNTRPKFLRDLLDSFAAEQASYAELIVSDDGSTEAATLDDLRRAESRPSVRVVFNKTNKGIASATNAGIAAARGHWVAFIDHDDLFVPGAIAIIVDAIAKNPDAHFFYTDEIIVDGDLKPIGSFIKPAYDSVLLSGANYINHFSIFRADRLAALGGLSLDREGSQDYDLLLRYLVDAPVGSVIHIPFLAYMWRREETSYSTLNLTSSVENARRALMVAYGSRVDRIEPALHPDFHRVRLTRQGAPLKVSIVIPNRDSPALIKRILGDLTERTGYRPHEIIIVDNGTTDKATLAFYATLQRDRPDVTIDIVSEPFNFARMCNRGIALARGDAILFLNNDIEVIDAGWLEEMVECLAFPDTGIVGAKLTYPSGQIQHYGVIVGLGGTAGHWYCESDGKEPGPMGRFLVRQTLTAVTGACMLVSRACLERLDGFDEERFAIAYNDIDLCIRARDSGFRTIWTPFAHLVHHESLTRGSDEAGASNVRFREEFARLQEKHGTATYIDDAYSPLFDRRYARATLLVPDSLQKTRPNAFG